LRYVRSPMNARSLAVSALLAAAVLVVASAVGAQDAGDAPPAASAGAGAAADSPDAASAADAGEPTSAVEATDGAPDEPAEAETRTASARDDAGRAEARRVVARRREAALVGGWVASTHDPASATVTVDDLVLGANGEWTRRVSRVGSDQGLLAPPAESSGTWFTEEGTVVLLDRGSAVDEVLRSPFSIDDRSERLTLEADGGPVLYYRFR